MSLLANTILENAAWWQNYWINNECTKRNKEDSTSKRGSCVDELKREYASGAEKEGTPWCAQFVSVIVKTSFQKLRLPASKLPYTASTLAMLEGAKKAKLIVDKTPRPGCIFFRTRSGGGHVGFVFKLKSDGTLYTIEGNSSNAVVARTYQKGSYDSYQFIHVQDEYEVSAISYLFRDKGKVLLYASGATAVGGAIFFGLKIYKNRKKKTGLHDELRNEILMKNSIMPASATSREVLS